MAGKPIPYFTDHRYDRLDELKRKLDAAWDTGELHYPEDHPEIATLKKEYEKLHRELHSGDLFDRVVQDTQRDAKLMDRVETFLERSPEHRQLLTSKTRDGRAIELEKNPAVRTKILKALEGEDKTSP